MGQSPVPSNLDWITGGVGCLGSGNPAARQITLDAANIGRYVFVPDLVGTLVFEACECFCMAGPKCVYDLGVRGDKWVALFMY